MNPEKTSWNKEYFKGMSLKQFTIYWNKHKFIGNVKDYHKEVCGEIKSK